MSQVRKRQLVDDRSESESYPEPIVRSPPRVKRVKIVKRPGEEAEDGHAKKKSKILVISSDEDDDIIQEFGTNTPREASSKLPFSAAMPKSINKSKSPVKATSKKTQPSPVRLRSWTFVLPLIRTKGSGSTAARRKGSFASSAFRSFTHSHYRDPMTTSYGPW